MPRGGKRGEYYPGRGGQPPKYDDPVEDLTVDNELTEINLSLDQDSNIV